MGVHYVTSRFRNFTILSHLCIVNLIIENLNNNMREKTKNIPSLYEKSRGKQLNVTVKAYIAESIPDIKMTTCRKIDEIVDILN